MQLETMESMDVPATETPRAVASWPTVENWLLVDPRRLADIGDVLEYLMKQDDYDFPRWVWVPVTV